jgi:quercetin dioxygenase-like cupin family protein
MITKSGCNIVRHSELQWEERIRFGDKKNRAKTYWHDVENNLYMRLVDQPANSIEPRHTHPGTHATTVLKGRALVDGLTLNTLDVILGPSNEPHGPLEYPDSSGCQLFSCFQGSNDHSGAEALSAEKNYRIVQSEQMTWDAKAGGALHMKVLVDKGAGRLMLTAMRLSAGFSVPVGSRPHMQAALVVDGTAVVDGEVLNAWDFMYMAAGVPHGPISFPNGATLLMVAMRPA